MEQNKTDYLLPKSPVLKLNLEKVEEEIASYFVKYVDLHCWKGFMIWGSRIEKPVALKHWDSLEFMLKYLFLQYLYN